MNGDLENLNAGKQLQLIEILLKFIIYKIPHLVINHYNIKGDSENSTIGKHICASCTI